MSDPIDEIESTSQWKSWQDPLAILIEEVTEWLEKQNLTSVSQEADHIAISKRKVKLIHALGRGLAEDAETESIDNILSLYVYQTDIWADAFNLIFEYIGENEHQFELNGAEFADTRPELIDDFSIYVQYWQEPNRKI